MYKYVTSQPPPPPETVFRHYACYVWLAIHKAVFTELKKESETDSGHHIIIFIGTKYTTSSTVVGVQIAGPAYGPFLLLSSVRSVHPHPSSFCHLNGASSFSLESLDLGIFLCKFFPRLRNRFKKGRLRHSSKFKELISVRNVEKLY